MASPIAVNLQALLKDPPRPCGPCSLCCKLVPIADKGLTKAAGTWCPHCTKPGCSIYPDRPSSCRSWSCTWALDKELPPELEPRRCHVVIDMMSDNVLLDDGSKHVQPVVQMWCDPAYPHAFEAPSIVAAMLYYAINFKFATLVRFNQERGIVIWPPPVSPTGKWERKESNMAVERQSFQDEIRQAHR